MPLAYFFDLAEADPARRKELKDAEDLKNLEDAKSMESAHRIQLISDVGYRQLDHIRYMRNNASAAHPNQNPITGLMRAEWLETCIREVITLPRNTIVAQIGRLLHNLKTKRLTLDEIDAAAASFDNPP
jgi:hypothetical protein